MNWKNIFTRKKIDPLDLDWGPITVDIKKDDRIVHIFNSNLNNNFCESRTISLLLNKYLYYKKHLPSDMTQEFILDIRGQNISQKHKDIIKSNIMTYINEVDSNLLMVISFFE